MATIRPGLIHLGPWALLFALTALLPGEATAAPRSAAFLKRYRPLVKALRPYLDREKDHARSWRRLESEVVERALAGDRVLADPEAVRWLTDQARAFSPPFTDRAWRTLHDVPAPRRDGMLRSILSEGLSLTWTQPRQGTIDGGGSRYPRHDPRPWLIALHEQEDAVGSVPAGVRVLQRRYPYALFPELYKSWFMLAPHAPRGAFVNEAGMLIPQRLVIPLAEFWTRYHVDHERVILDGMAAALDAAAAFPYWLAGLVLRGGSLTPQRVAQVRNYAALPVFVLDDRVLAADLTTAGHPDVTLGSPVELRAWLGARKRVLPKRYRWDATHLQHARGWWTHVEARIPGAERSTLAVAVVDSAKEPNTVRVEARGVRTLSIFLADEVVDLDRPVRIVINGQEVQIVRAAHPRFARDMRMLWATKPLDPRRSRNYGRLFPAQAARLDVPPPR